jgi:hypothetical protein
MSFIRDLRRAGFREWFAATPASLAGPCRVLPDGDKHEDKARFKTGIACRWIRIIPMKLVLTALGVVLLIIAGMYFVVPADQLPSFLPGHEDGVTRVHMKHGIAAGVVGIILLAAGVWMGRR